MGRRSLLVGILWFAGQVGADTPVPRLPVHMAHGLFTFEVQAPIREQAMEITWLKAGPPPAGLGYYAMYFFTFRNKVGGYMGLQWDREKKAIFSLWDEAGRASALPEGHCRRFGHEGSGSSCILPYTWEVGESYRVTLRSMGLNETGERWQATVARPGEEEATVIGTIQVLDGDDRRGYGPLAAGATATLEYYGSLAMACGDMPEVQVQWRGPFANGRRTVLAAKASYPVEAHNGPPRTCPNSNVTSPGAGYLIHQAGGTTRRVTRQGSWFYWGSEATPGP